MQTKISYLNKIKIVGYALGLMSLVVATQLAFAPKAEATTYNVTPSSACNLEDALASAATDAPVGSCDAGDADDTINVGAGTYTLSADLGVLVTPGNISIIGESATSTIIDGADFAGLTVAAPGNYLIESLTLQNFTADAEGNGLIVNVIGSNVVANKLIVKDNICADSIPVCAIAVTYSDNNLSTTISNSTFTNNTAFALFSNTRVPIDGGTSGSSVMNIFNNTIYDNNAALLGTVNAAPDGTSTTNFYNNTVAQNTPYTEFFDLAFIVNIGEFEAYYPASLNLRNNIFYGNTLLGGEDGNCANLVGENGTVTSDGGNISSDATCNSLFTSTNDKNSTDPLLGAYQQVGSTFVMPLQAGSPALENAVAGTPATPSIDQRGVARPQAALADSGAYEYVYPTPDSGGGGGSLAGTGWDAKTPALIAGILVLSGILATGYALKRR